MANSTECHVATCPAHSGFAARIDNIEGWQKTQNGTLKTLDEKVDKLDAKMDAKFDKWIYFFMAQLMAVILLAAGIWVKG